MAKRIIDNIKLGVFVLAGLLFLVLALYMIGKNRNLFGRNFELRTHFVNVQGLKPGNNVRYAGIEVGTVRSLRLTSDTSIEVVFMVKRDLLGVIKQDAEVSIGTDGLVGNRVLNIIPGKTNAPEAAEGGRLKSHQAVSTEDMLEVLSGTNQDMAQIAEELKTSIKRINANTVLWDLLEDETMAKNIRVSLNKVRQAAGETNELVISVHALVEDVRAGQGALGYLLTDTILAKELPASIQQIKLAGSKADSAILAIETAVKDLEMEILSGGGPAQALLQDSLLVKKLHATLTNVEQGTASFTENMEALKHNILLRRYFKRQEKAKNNP